jgi:hypothetical protein
MRIVFRLVLAIALGIIAAALDMTMWNAWFIGHPHMTPIMGVVTRRGITSADPMGVLCLMTILFNAAFLTATLAWFFPGVGIWARQKRDAVWPPPKDPDPGPIWICPHCQEENPGNFAECWKCQKMRLQERSGHSQ